MSDEFSPAVTKAMETFQTGLKMAQEIRRLKEENERQADEIDRLCRQMIVLRNQLDAMTEKLAHNQASEI